MQELISMESLLLQLLRGNKDATALCLTVFNWANDYDHLVDRDVDDEATVHRAMDAMLALMVNPFFQDNQVALHNTLLNCVSAWKISTQLQRGAEPKGHEIAHVLRWVPIEFFLHCARILHGEGWVQQVGPWFWLEMTRAHSFEEFARECGGN